MPEQKERKKPRVRSPAYPAFDLEVAIGHAQAVYDKERRHAAPVAVVARHCGTELTSSLGLRLISGLKQFGLVVEEGRGEDRQVRLSERALDILLAESDSPERVQAIRAAALGPKIHRLLWDHYEGNLPSNDSLRVHLIRKLEFNDKKVTRFIKEFRATLAFAKLDESDKMEDENGDQENDEPEDVASNEERHGRRTPPQREAVVPRGGNAMIRDFPVPLISGGVAVLQVPFPMSEEDYEQLTATLTAWKRALVGPREEREEEDGE